jgi:hypothetical protein
MSRRRFVATALAGTLALAAPSLAFARKLKVWNLKSKYTGERVFGNARTVSLSLTWNDAASGEGRLSLDPNITDGKSSTCIAIDEVSVEVEHLYDTEPLRNAMGYYELRERSDKEVVRPGGRRWRLERTLTGKTVYTLKAIDQHGHVTATIELFESV